MYLSIYLSIFIYIYIYTHVSVIIYVYTMFSGTPKGYDRSQLHQACPAGTSIHCWRPKAHTSNTVISTQMCVLDIFYLHLI